MKFLIDEDISPSVARYLCEELLVDAVAVRDRGLLGKNDRYLIEFFIFPLMEKKLLKIYPKP